MPVTSLKKIYQNTILAFLKSRCIIAHRSGFDNNFLKKFREKSTCKKLILLDVIFLLFITVLVRTNVCFWAGEQNMQTKNRRTFDCALLLFFITGQKLQAFYGLFCADMV